MIIKTGAIVDEICKKAGITKRVKPASTVLSKKEFMQIHSYIIMIEKERDERSPVYYTSPN